MGVPEKETNNITKRDEILVKQNNGGQPGIGGQHLSTKIHRHKKGGTCYCISKTLAPD